jgi:hypothetical protein
MGSRSEIIAFGAFLAVCVSLFFRDALWAGKVLSPADVLQVSASFRSPGVSDYEPANRLLMDPVLQFQPWLEFNRTMIRSGRLPLWNGYAGCGAPHLANGQSAVFDPFHLFAYLGTTPQAYAWIAAARLWAAGLGMFLLARSWGLRVYGRWFAGLTYPFCGFLILWLLYPVTSVAIWMPWLFLATDRVFRTQNARSAGWLAVVVALVLFGGHIQTSAHVMLAGGLYALAKCFWERRLAIHPRRALIAWTSGTCLGLGLAAIQIIPLGFYLSKSSVWSDRRSERPAWWVIDRPRLLDAACTAAPYLYGSQRRGHPNLARAFGVHNLNESAGGHVGLATLIWLAPLAAVVGRREPRVLFLTGLVVFGLLGAFRFPPVDNLLRALPVLGVTDNRRLTLWVAFGLSLLGGMGLDHLEQTRRLARAWLVAWVMAALFLGAAACAIPALESKLRARAEDHYRQAALESSGADRAGYHERAERQVREALRFLPRYHALVALELLLLAFLANRVCCSQRAGWTLRLGLIGLTLFDLGLLGLDLNPAISAELNASEPPVIVRLRQGLPAGARALGVGEELPPNMLMRFGLADARNYDSVELASSLAWFRPLYDSAGGLTSRGEVNWARASAAQGLLIESGVGAIVGGSPPPKGTFDRVEQVGRVWIAWLGGKPWATSECPSARLSTRKENGRGRVLIDADRAHTITMRETWDPGWKAVLDGKPVKTQGKSPVFVNIEVPPGQHELILRYDPDEVRFAGALSFSSLLITILVLTGNRLFWIPGITTAKGLDGPEPSG